MPTYPHRCLGCSHVWDVVCRIAERNDRWDCPKCSDFGERQLTAANLNGASDWNNQSWNPALGCYTKSTAEARKIAKSRGMDEVGTEPPEKIHKHYAKQREEKNERRWADDREMAYD